MTVSSSTISQTCTNRNRDGSGIDLRPSDAEYHIGRDVQVVADDRELSFKHDTCVGEGRRPYRGAER